MEDIGLVIKQYRMLKGISQEFIAYKFGMSQRNYSKLETGQISITIKRLEEISMVLEISVMQLIKSKSTKNFKI